MVTESLEDGLLLTKALVIDNKACRQATGSSTPATPQDRTELMSKCCWSLLPTISVGGAHILSLIPQMRLAELCSELLHGSDMAGRLSIKGTKLAAGATDMVSRISPPCYKTLGQHPLGPKHSLAPVNTPLAATGLQQAPGVLRHGRLARSGAPREVLEEAELQVSVNDLNVLVWRHIPWHLRHGGINMLNALPPIMRQHGSAVYALDRPWFRWLSLAISAALVLSSIGLVVVWEGMAISGRMEGIILEPLEKPSDRRLGPEGGDEFLSLGLSTVCRSSLRNIKEIVPSQGVVKTNLPRQSCEDLCIKDGRCRGYEYRYGDAQRDLNVFHNRTVSGAPDFECVVRQPTCRELRGHKSLKNEEVNSLSFYLMEFCDAGPTPELYGPCSKRYAEDADPLSL
eukprot:s641_g9.t1